MPTPTGWANRPTCTVDGAEVAVNKYFVNHPEQVLGNWSRKDTLYGTEGFSVTSNGELADQLREAVGRLPDMAHESAFGIKNRCGNSATENGTSTGYGGIALKRRRRQERSSRPLHLSSRHIGEGSFFVGDDSRIHQMTEGQTVPVVYGGSATLGQGEPFSAGASGDLIGLRDKARRVLQSQNEGWPEQNRNDARRDLNWAYDRFVMAYGPINKTTFGETKDGTTIRRMPNLVKFREDPDAMLVMALEEYDEATGKADQSRDHRSQATWWARCRHVTSVQERRGGSAGVAQ